MQLSRMLCALGLGLVAMTTASSPVGAAEIQPVSVTASSAYVGGGTDNRAAVNASNGAGLTANATATSFDDPHTNAVSGPAHWLANGPTDATPTITWDLGANYSLSGFHLWNYNEVTSAADYQKRGINLVDIRVSSTAAGEDFVEVESNRTGFTEASGLNTYTGEDYTLATDSRYSDVRRVRFFVEDNFASGDAYIGISEIRFVGTAVPGPASAGLLALASMGLVKRRRV